MILRSTCQLFSGNSLWDVSECIRTDWFIKIPASPLFHKYFHAYLEPDPTLDIGDGEKEDSFPVKLKVSFGSKRSKCSA